MRQIEKVITWVVYRMTIHGKPTGMSAVCEQGEWEAMERGAPGYHTLIQAGITWGAEMGGPDTTKRR